MLGPICDIAVFSGLKLIESQEKRHPAIGAFESPDAKRVGQAEYFLP
jgi:hypothetical protein